MKGPLALALVGALAGVAHADARVTTPVNHFVLAMPSSWHLVRGLGPSNLDVVRSDSAGDLAIGWVSGDCDEFFQHQASQLGVTMSAATPGYVPSGWQVQTWSKDGKPAFLGCHPAGETTFAAQWWNELPDPWPTDMTAMLSALDGAHRASGASAADNLVTLAGSAMVAQVPDALLYDHGEPTIDQLELASGGLVEVGKFANLKCAAVINQAAPNAQDAGEAAVAGWHHWTTDLDIYCNDTGDAAYAVDGPRGDAATALLLDSLMGELTPPQRQEIAHLPGSRWKVGLPVGWTASDAGSGATAVKTPDGTITIRKSSQACEQVVVAGGSRQPYEPSWLDESWKAVLDPSDAVTLCTKVDAGTIEVSMPHALLRGHDRRIAADLLDGLRADQSPDPAIPHKPLLPFPIEVALQTISGSPRGWGARLGVERWGLGGRVMARGELGLDSQTGISYDVRVGVGVPLGKSFRFYGAAGRDQVGTGANEATAGDFYYGMGAEVGLWENDARVYAALEYLWRHQPSPPMGMMLDEALHPSHEWRFRSELVIPDSKKLFDGVSLDYREAGGTGMWILGVYTRL